MTARAIGLHHQPFARAGERIAARPDVRAAIVSFAAVRIWREHDEPGLIVATLGFQHSIDAACLGRAEAVATLSRRDVDNETVRDRWGRRLDPFVGCDVSLLWDEIYSVASSRTRRDIQD